MRSPLQIPLQPSFASPRERLLATPGGPTAARRFTRDGSDALEGQLSRICDAVLVRVPPEVPASRLEAILLGGGYGRGEGGVLRTAAGDQPYNDLEFYVGVRGNRLLHRRGGQARLHHLASTMTAEFGIDIEFQVVSLPALRRAPPSRFYYDLIAAHHWVYGHEGLLAGCEHFRCAASIPIAEATRLLMNRCTGLLLAQEKLRPPRLLAADADFVGRNLAKTQLALGDAVLTRFGEYHWSCIERQARLSGLLAQHWFAWGAAVARHHALGVEFKLHPHQADCQSTELRARQAELAALAREVWLWLEQERLGRVFVAIEDYAFDDLNKCPGTSPWRNVLLNLATAPFPFGTQTRRHPRERLLNALVLLLWGMERPGTHVRGFLQRCLGARTSDPAALLDAYLTLWKRFR